MSLFKEQIATLKEFLATATPSEEQAKNIDFLLSLGELFTLVAYGQLLLEKYKMDNLENDLVEQIFDFMVRDFSKFALQIYSKPDSTAKQMDLCMKMIKRPVVDTERFNASGNSKVYALKDTYEMNPYAENGVSAQPADLVANEAFTAMMARDITEHLKKTFGGYEVPRKFIFLENDFSVENSMLTQTLKLKRGVVIENYQAAINSLYVQPEGAGRS
jgi:hypothetical protein